MNRKESGNSHSWVHRSGQGQEAKTQNLPIEVLLVPLILAPRHFAVGPCKGHRDYFYDA